MVLLSTVVLNSRDRYEIQWHPLKTRVGKQPAEHD